MASLTSVPANIIALNKHNHNDNKSSGIIIIKNSPGFLPKRKHSCFSLSSYINNNNLFNASPRTLSVLSSSLGGGGVESSSSSSVVSKDTTTLLQRVEVFDLNGNSVLISDLWKDRKAVVAFARHFGCVLCRKRAAYLADNKDIMDASGVALVIIGPGSVDQAKTFAEQTSFKGEVYADPTYSSYKALSFVLELQQHLLLGFEDYSVIYGRLSTGLGAFIRKGHQRKRQQGGIIVAGPGISNISYLHKDKEAGDDPDIEDILKACCS